MPVEIERKFSVIGRPWEQVGIGVSIRQAYLSKNENSTVRIRVAGDEAWLTVKGPTRGISRDEFEYSIPRFDAESLLGLCGDGVIQKSRYRLVEQGSVFEVDVFEGANQGLVVAEIELASEGQDFFRPDWLGEELSFDPRYRNSELSTRPYSSWDD